MWELWISPRCMCFSSRVCSLPRTRQSSGMDNAVQIGSHCPRGLSSSSRGYLASQSALYLIVTGKWDGVAGILRELRSHASLGTPVSATHSLQILGHCTSSSSSSNHDLKFAVIMEREFSVPPGDVLEDLLDQALALFPHAEGFKKHLMPQLIKQAIVK